MQYSYSKEIFIGKAEPIRIIGGPGNQLPDKLDSIVLLSAFMIGSLCSIKRPYREPRKL